MKPIIAYYPIMDMLLAVRQLYMVERFKPYVNAMELMNGRLAVYERDAVIRIGDRTEGWLGVIERFIELSRLGLVNPEELILAILKQPDILINEKVPKDITEELSIFLKCMWSSYFNVEAGRHGKNTLDKVFYISDLVEKQGLMNFILATSDRMEKFGDNALKVHIKPDHTINLDKVTSAIIMPSIYASRRLTFWYSGFDYIFYISMDTFNYDNIEPSDMLLLRTLAVNDRTRLKMLRLLTERSYSTNEMAEKLNMNASTVSRHFKVFKDVGFVDICSQEGNFIYYSLNMNEIENSLSSIIDYIKNKE